MRLLRTICRQVLPLAMPLLLTSCGLLQFATLATVGTVGGAGYLVYKTGEAAVVTTGKAASGVSQGVQNIVFFNNELKATCPADVRSTQMAASRALAGLGFRGVGGNADASSGSLSALTADQRKIEIKLKVIDARQTSIAIRVGAKGDLKTSDLIYKTTLAGLGASTAG